MPVPNQDPGSDGGSQMEDPDAVDEGYITDEEAECSELSADDDAEAVDDEDVKPGCADSDQPAAEVEQPQLEEGETGEGMDEFKEVPLPPNDLSLSFEAVASDDDLQNEDKSYITDSPPETSKTSKGWVDLPPASSLSMPDLQRKLSMLRKQRTAMLLDSNIFFSWYIDIGYWSVCVGYMAALFHSRLPLHLHFQTDSKLAKQSLSATAAPSSSSIGEGEVIEIHDSLPYGHDTAETQEPNENIEALVEKLKCDPPRLRLT